MIYFLILCLFGFTQSVPQCPRNSLSFDYEQCDPGRRSQCPSGFTCRKGHESENSEIPAYLCCESEDMTVAEWFAEALIAPQVFPQAPLDTLETVQLSPLDATTVFPKIHIGDEIVVLTFPNYVTGMIQTIEFKQAPPTGGYLHVMSVVDPGYLPYGVFFWYNLPSQGSQQVTVTGNSSSMMFTAHLDNSTSVPKRDSYRAQYVVLVFWTTNPISLGSQTGVQQGTNGCPSCGSSAASTVDLMAGCGDVGCLLTNTTTGRSLGQPVAGTLFYLTTRRTMFPTSEGGLRDDQSIAINCITPLLIALVYLLF